MTAEAGADRQHDFLSWKPVRRFSRQKGVRYLEGKAPQHCGVFWLFDFINPTKGKNIKLERLNFFLKEIKRKKMKILMKCIQLSKPSVWMGGGDSWPCWSNSVQPLASPFMALPLGWMQWPSASRVLVYSVHTGPLTVFTGGKWGPWYDMKPRRLRMVHGKKPRDMWTTPK